MGVEPDGSQWSTLEISDCILSQGLVDAWGGYGLARCPDAAGRLEVAA